MHRRILRLLSCLVAVFSAVLVTGTALAEDLEGFDVTSPGSQPLSEAKENRLGRYINEGTCPVTYDVTLRDRCDFLLRLARFRQQQQVKQAQPRLRSRGIIDTGQLIRRPVGGEYSRSLRYVNSVIRVRKQHGGLLLRPRTLQEGGEVLRQELDARQARRVQRRALRQGVEEPMAEPE